MNFKLMIISTGLLVLALLLAAIVLLRPVQAAMHPLNTQVEMPALTNTKVYTNEGPLIITGTQVYTIENTTFVQHGPIEVHDQATLVIRDSTVEFQQSYHEEFPWRFDGSGRLVMERGTITSSYTYLIAFVGASQALITNSALPSAFMPLASSATVTITNSSARHVSLDPVNFGTGSGQIATLNATNAVFHEMSLAVTGEATGTVRSLRPGLLADWTLNEVQNAQIAVRLLNTQVNNINWLIGSNAHLTFDDCQFWQIGPRDNATIIVRNSHVGQATMILANSHHSTLRGLTSGQAVAHWSLHEADPTTNVPFEYVVDNSRIDGWYIRSQGADLTLEDCDLHGSRLRPEFDAPTTTTRVVRTYLDELFLWWSHGTVAFEDSTVNHVINPFESTTRLTGTVRFEQKAINTDNGPWNQSVLAREFPVQVNDANGLPMAGVPLQLLDPSGSPIWSGQTGVDGRAAFEIAFTDTNYTNIWTLRAWVSNLPVQFLSDTPILVSLCYDFNGDRQVDVNDIQAVAAHWRQRTSDPRWEARFDVTGDGVINIVDIMKVATHWGKTCTP